MEAAPTEIGEVGGDLRQQRVGGAHQGLAGEARQRQRGDRAHRLRRWRRGRRRRARGMALTASGVAGFVPRHQIQSTMQTMIDKTYQPTEVEGRIYAEWEQAGAFRAGRPERAPAAPYSIVIPPPNVTGSLHMGHALNNTLQDILARFERMRGQGRAVAARHRPRRHRHADGGRAAVDGAPGARPPRHGPRRSSWSGSGPGRRNPAAPSPASSSGSAPRATGRASASPWTRACRAPC